MPKVTFYTTDSSCRPGLQSPAKAVYNARHWNQPEPEEIPTPTLSRSQTAPVGYLLLVGLGFSSVKVISASARCANCRFGICEKIVFVIFYFEAYL